MWSWAVTRVCAMWWRPVHRTQPPQSTHCAATLRWCPPARTTAAPAPFCVASPPSPPPPPEDEWMRSSCLTKHKQACGPYQAQVDPYFGCRRRICSSLFSFKLGLLCLLGGQRLLQSIKLSTGHAQRFCSVKVEWGATLRLFHHRHKGVAPFHPAQHCLGLLPGHTHTHTHRCKGGWRVTWEDAASYTRCHTAERRLKEALKPTSKVTTGSPSSFRVNTMPLAADE